jgi:hypothetical protein
MSRPISLFADYHAGENSVTNYCGLVMKILYEESPKSFEEVLISLLPNDTKLTVGPTFSQQRRQKKTIPDLAITQRSFSVFFETKLSDWFYKEQNWGHIDGFNLEAQDKILFLLSNFESDEPEAKFASDIELARKEHQVILQPISFEDLLGALENVRSSEAFKKILDEFKLYLDRNNLLPKWKYLLDVVNCAGSFNEIDEGVYICPDTGGAYSHRRAKYFGAYANKQVSKIFEIRAVVSIDRDLGEGTVKWNNSGEAPDILINQATKIISKSEFRKNENKKVPLQVFLLEKGKETCFQKINRGGMQGSKQYFWDIASNCQTSEELAELLNGKSWSDFKS